MLGTRQSATESTSGAVSGGADPLKIPIDPNGNLSTKTEGSDTWGYEWNAKNQLTRVTKNAIEQARFSYDPRGRRVEKVAGGVTTSYTYSGRAILREVRGTAIVKYVQGLQIDEPLAADDGTSLSYFHADALGSIVKTTNASGTVTGTRQYDAWGNLQLGGDQPGYAFTGREWDSEMGLYYYRARYYDPSVGRFISEDPIGLRGGMNLYRYVRNRPTRFRDPLGLCPITTTVIPTCMETGCGCRIAVLVIVAGCGGGGTASGGYLLPGKCPASLCEPYTVTQTAPDSAPPSPNDDEGGDTTTQDPGQGPAAGEDPTTRGDEGDVEIINAVPPDIVRGTDIGPDDPDYVPPPEK